MSTFVTMFGKITIEIFKEILVIIQSLIGNMVSDRSKTVWMKVRWGDANLYLRRQSCLRQCFQTRRFIENNT